MTSLRSAELCPRCSGTAIGVFPHVTLGCADKAGQCEIMSALALSLYTCADCGFSELFMKTPIRRWERPVDQQDLAFEWLRPPSDTPFR